MADLRNVEVMKVGTWTGSRKVEVTDAMLAEIARNFSEINVIEGFGVPVKLGHNSKIGEPAFGWMSSLNKRGSSLFADFRDVPSEIVDAVGKRRYNAVSVEMLPKVEYSGRTFNNVLSGVALLGAEWPAIKGMKPLSAAEFAAQEERIEFTQEMEMPQDFNQSQVDAFVLAAETKVRTELQALVNEANSKLSAAETRATVAETALHVLQGEQSKSLFAAAIDTAIAEGRLLPKQKDQMLGFAGSFPAEVEVAGKKVKAIDAFKEFLAGLPAKVKFGEQSRQSPTPAPAQEGAPRASVSNEVNDAVQAYMAEHPKTEYEAAMKAVFTADPDLKQRYAFGA